MGSEGPSGKSSVERSKEAIKIEMSIRSWSWSAQMSHSKSFRVWICTSDFWDRFSGAKEANKWRRDYVADFKTSTIGDLFLDGRKSNIWGGQLFEKWLKTFVETETPVERTWIRLMKSTWIRLMKSELSSQKNDHGCIYSLKYPKISALLLRPWAMRVLKSTFNGWKACSEGVEFLC